MNLTSRIVRFAAAWFVLTLAPFGPASVPAGQAPTLFKTNVQNQWEQVSGAAFGANTIVAQITSFSSAQTAVQSLAPSPNVGREWSFRELRADGSESELPPPDGAGTQEGAAAPGGIGHERG